MGALLAWAIHCDWRGGLVAGAVLVVADLSVRDDLTQATYGNVFLLLVGGPVVGFLCESLQLMAAERDAGPARGAGRGRAGPAGAGRARRRAAGAGAGAAARRRARAATPPSSGGSPASRSARCAP